jgi:hypothetical protein
MKYMLILWCILWFWISLSQGVIMTKVAEHESPWVLWRGIEACANSVVGHWPIFCVRDSRSRNIVIVHMGVPLVPAKQQFIVEVPAVDTSKYCDVFTPLLLEYSTGETQLVGCVTWFHHFIWLLTSLFHLPFSLFIA